MKKTGFEFLDKDGIGAAVISNDNGLAFKFLENGALFSITGGNNMINQMMTSPVESAPGGIYVRSLGKKIDFFPVMGPRSSSEFSFGKGAALWKGRHGNFEYECRLELLARQNTWFWNVTVTNNGKKKETVDVVFSQDLGLASMGMVRSNEAYSSQYIDHEPLKHPKFGYCISSRQGQKQDKGFPWIMHGCLDSAAGYLVDGFQFFGLGYKAGGAPQALLQKKLPNKRVQYEFAMPALQSKPATLAPGEKMNRVFFACYMDNHPTANGTKDLSVADKASREWKKLKIPSATGFSAVKGSASLFDISPLFESRNLSAAEITKYFGKNLRHEEKGLSFFCGRDTHVALRAKELSVERPHGHVMRSGMYILPSDDTLSSTAWMYGIFNSHVTIGNTNFNKLLSFSRNHLNVQRSSGQRIFVKTGGGYELLGVPSAFETGLNHARWIYKGADGGTIIVTSWVSAKNPACFLEIESDRAREFLISHLLVLGNNDLDHTGKVIIDEKNGIIELEPARKGLLFEKYPGTRFFIVSPDSGGIASISGDEALYADGKRRNGPFVAVTTAPVKKFSLALCGSVLSAAGAQKLAGALSGRREKRADSAKAFAEFWSGLSGGASLAHKDEGVSKLNDIIPWYVHDAMVHFTAPHGLEQYGGAAWGLRDVCQGPAEFLCATRHFNEQRAVIKMVYANQYKISGDWPQWFMYDRYGKIRAGDSHGDIIFWPLKALCEYVEATNDFSILNERVPYVDDKTCEPVKEAESIAAHVAKEIAAIKAGCVKGTALYHYGHGDWEDTLQPADPAMREYMVSAWTVELCYQTLLRYEEICRRNGSRDEADAASGFCARIRQDFNRYLVRDGVVAGLAFFKGKTPVYMLHPQDTKTGVKFRLLPMTRGIISGMFSAEQAKAHYGLVKKHLLFPDGVRLTDRPIPYKGGVEVYFKRAESAANFGREIGMQYVHAHIRYVEAMCKLGNADEAYKGLLAVCPITLNKVFKTAMPRQSNAYFSSSDAAFNDRYEALRRFGDIKKLKVGIKGGWRVYSSGPGIYLNQVISNFLGIRSLFEDIVLDPVIPHSLDGLTYEQRRDGKKVVFKYIAGKNTSSPYAVHVNGKPVSGIRYSENPYRRGGVLINKNAFNALLRPGQNTVEIFL